MIDGFYFEERLRHGFQDRHMVHQGLHGIIVRFVEVLVHFFIDDGRYGLAVVSFRAELLAEEDLFLMFAEDHRSQSIAHAPFHDHLAEDAGHLLEVAGGAAGDLIENDFFRTAAAESDTQLSEKMRLRDEGTFFMREHHGVAARLSARNDGDFMHRIRILQKGRHDGMAGFMVRGDPSFLIAHLMALSFRSVADFFAGLFQIGHGDRLSVLTGSQKGCFIQHVRKIGPCEARDFLCDGIEIDIRFQRLILRMDTQDRKTASEVRTADDDTAVETARTQKRRIEDIRTVRRSEGDDAFVRAEAIHLDQELVQRLFSFVVSAAEAATSLTAHCIDFIDEYDAWCILLCLGKEVTDTGSTNTDKHFYKVRTGDGEEWHPRFTGHRFGKQGLTCPWRADEEHALRDLRTDRRIATRIFQEIHHFGELFLRFVFPSDIREIHMDLAFGGHLRSGLAKAHDTSAAALCLVHDPEPHADQNDDRKQRREQIHPPGRLFRRFCSDDDATFRKLRQKLRVIVRCIGSEFAAVLQLTADGIVRHRHGVDILLLDLRNEIAVGDFRVFFLRMNKGIEYGDRYNDQKHIEGHILYKFIQYFPPSLYFL